VGEGAQHLTISVLACRARVSTEDVQLEVPKPEEIEALFVPVQAEVLDEPLLPEGTASSPLVAHKTLTVAPPTAGDGRSDLDRLRIALRETQGVQESFVGLGGLRDLAEAVRAADGKCTATLWREQERTNVIRVHAGEKKTGPYGLAVDVGTTTVAVEVVDLQKARAMAACVDYNGQLACGQDVISRINYAQRPERLAELRHRVRETINRLTAKACARCDVRPQDVTAAWLSGNTTMQHLLLGLPPEQIRLAPYTPTVLDFPVLCASEVGLAIAADAPAYLSPCTGSYVGGDITAGVLCCDLPEGDAPALFIDIGTNGEIVLGNHEFLLACACSAGPAFEGGGIECGLRACAGAIEWVTVDPATGAANCRTIGGAAPRGICGSGIFGLTAELLRTKWLDRSGRLVRDRQSPSIRVEGRRAEYLLASEEESAGGVDIVYTEQDLTNLLRAKAAIYSACALLVEQAEMTFSGLRRVYVAGGFGEHLDLEAAITIGLLPDLPRERFTFLGNSSLRGSAALLVDATARRRQREIANRMTYLELSTTPDYMAQYTGALFLPHTELEQFPTVRVALK
jgi:uncharacterized 2Fe-2S/4Fe-4S cluster protein (DUF4445 family)